MFKNIFHALFVVSLSFISRIFSRFSSSFSFKFFQRICPVQYWKGQFSLLYHFQLSNKVSLQWRHILSNNNFSLADQEQFPDLDFHFQNYLSIKAYTVDLINPSRLYKSLCFALPALSCLLMLSFQIIIYSSKRLFLIPVSKLHFSC